MRRRASARMTPVVQRRALAAALCGAVVGVGCLALPTLAQEVAPRLTGAMVIDDLAKTQQSIDARAKSSGDAGIAALASKLTALANALHAELGGDTDKPTATLGNEQRAAVVRADAISKRVDAWLDASGFGCTKTDASTMLAAVSATVDALAADTASQKAPLPVLNGVQTIDKRPLFVLRGGGKDAPRFVLTGENLVDAQCANPKVVAFDAAGHPASVQPQLVAAQATQVEMSWAGAEKLAPGNYTLQLTTQRKAFLIGCTSEPAAQMVLHVAPPQRFTVNYALVGTCGGSTVPLASQTLALAARGQTITTDVDAGKCPNPTSYTLTASAHADDGASTTMGPVTQGADASITGGVGNGISLTWDPSMHQLFVRSGQQGCKGVY